MFLAKIQTVLLGWLTIMAECAHHVDQSFCGICRKLPRITDPVGVRYMTFALVERSCGECAGPVKVGDPAAWLTNGAYVHRSCIRNAVQVELPPDH